MSIKKLNDKDIFENVIDIGLRMYGNGYSYPKEIVIILTEYCRQKIYQYFIKHNKIINNKINNHISYLHTLIYTSRHKKSSLKRLQQFLQAKDRQLPQQNELIDKIIKDKKLTINNRFNRICSQLNIDLNSNQLDIQRCRQYARLDEYYNSDKLTSNDYLIFIDQQHTSFNNLRLLSSIDIAQWLNLNNNNINLIINHQLRLAEICLFLIKEILLNLMDKVHLSKIPCEISDIFRREYISKNRRLPYSRRKKISSLI